MKTPSRIEDETLNQAVQAWFLSSLKTNPADMEPAKKQLCKKYALSTRTFDGMVQNCSLEWSAQIEEMENFIRKSDLIERWMARIEKKERHFRISKSAMKDLLVCFLCLILQNASIELGTSQLKKKKVLLLFELLEQKEALGSYEKVILRPFVRIARGKRNPGSEEYLMAELLLIEMISQFYCDFSGEEHSRLALDERMFSLLEKQGFKKFRQDPPFAF